MIKKLINFSCFLFFIFFSLPAEEKKSAVQKEDAMMIHSGEAQYDGKEFVLMGQVVVEHPIGQISAHCLSIQPSFNKDKKNKLGFLKIKDDIQIELTEGGGILCCEQAEIDYAKMQGIFLGSSHKPDVIYSNIKKGENHTKQEPPLEIKSHRITLTLVKENTDPPVNSKTVVQQIEAHENIRIHYQQNYLLLADHALYQRLPDEVSPYAGLLTLTTRQNLPTCQMTNLNGDQLTAQMIQINILERKLCLNQPQGKLYMRRDKQPSQIMEFSAHELIWDDQKQNLLLKQQVKVKQNDSLHIDTPHEIFLSQKTSQEGKKTVRLLYAAQNTHISYSDEKKNIDQEIDCPGSLTIDHERQEMNMQGLKVSEENQGQQVYIKDTLGKMYADHVFLQYLWENGQFVPKKIILEGHVRLINCIGVEAQKDSFLQYALADRIECLPATHEMVLTSQNGQRVLFVDKINHVQMSAPSLKIQQDVKTKKNAIQGLGDVRFTFIDQEFEQLKRHFSFENSLKELKSESSQYQ